MELQLVNKSICESKLFKNTSSFKNLTGEQVANLLYLNTLAVYLMTQDRHQSRFAKEYARKTGNNGPFVLFKTTATDLYMLAFQVNAPNNNSSSMPDKEREYLQRLNFDNKRFQRTMLNLASGSLSDAESSAFLTRLERQLRVFKNRYKSWRRSILSWESVPKPARADLVRLLKRELQVLAPTGEIYPKLNTMVNYGNFDHVNDKGSLAKKAVGIGLGAVAGAKLGSKLDRRKGRRLGSDKYKKAGAGLGAVAGYWATKDGERR